MALRTATRSRPPVIDATISTPGRHRSVAPIAAVTLMFVSTVAVTLGAVALTAWGVVGGVVAVTFVPAIITAAVDLHTGRLPDALVLATGCPVFAFAVIGGPSVGWHPLAQAAAGAAVMASPLLALHLIAPRSMGFGDVKFAAALGASIGLLDWRMAPFALAVASGSTLAVACGRRSAALPFGPSLVAGAVGAVLAGACLPTTWSGFGGEVASWR